MFRQFFGGTFFLYIFALCHLKYECYEETNTFTSANSSCGFNIV